MFNKINTRNLKLRIEYDGTRYCGWQVQNHRAQNTPLASVQEVIEKALLKILQEKIKLSASGRTDAGVHALGQIAHFQTVSGMEVKKLRLALNSVLPDDIVISSITQVKPDFHSRYHARSKIYRYTILNRPFPSPFLKNTSYYIPYFLDVVLMRKEAIVLIGKHDFKSFRLTDKKKKDSIRIIRKISVVKRKDLIYITIEANGFLYTMARSIVGTLVDLGRGKLLPGSLRKILTARSRARAGHTAPARGLCLLQVKYR